MPTIGGSIILKSTTPNFERDRVQSIYDLKNARVSTYDIGHIVYCAEDGNHYKFMGKYDAITNEFGVENDDKTGYFRLFTTGGGVDDEVIEEIQQQVGEASAKIEEASTQINSNTQAIQELYNAVYPTTVSLTVKSGSLTVSSKNLKGSTVKNVNLIFSVKQNNQVITPKAISLNVNGIKTDLDATATTHTLGDITENTSISITFTLESGITKTTATSHIKFYPYSYYGVINDGVDVDATVITGLNKILLDSRSYTITVTQDNQKNCFAYPSSFGSLTSIKDDKNYELISSYIKTSVTVNDELYNVYTLQYPSTVNNYKLIFS